MGLFDSIKTKLGSNKAKVNQGIDKAAQTAAGKAGVHGDKVRQGAEMAKDAVNKLPDT